MSEIAREVRKDKDSSEVRSSKTRLRALSLGTQFFIYHNLQKTHTHQQISSLYVTSSQSSEAHCCQSSTQQGKHTHHG